jgi:hypothetical protein
MEDKCSGDNNQHDRKKSASNSGNLNGGNLIAAVAGIALVAGVTWLWSKLPSREANTNGNRQQPPDSNGNRQPPDSNGNRQQPPDANGNRQQPPDANGNRQQPASVSAIVDQFDPNQVERAGENDTCCAVCMENKPNCALLPCRHMRLCSGCAALCQDCPMCRAPIGNRLTLYV